MKTILIHEQDPELLSAWASYLSQDGFAVFTSTNSLEAAEIVSMVKIDSVVISSNDPATFLLFGKVLKSKKRQVNIVAITQVQSSVLELLLERGTFILLETPFTFSALKGVVNGQHIKAEVMQNALF